MDTFRKLYVPLLSLAMQAKVQVLANWKRFKLCDCTVGWASCKPLKRELWTTVAWVMAVTGWSYSWARPKQFGASADFRMLAHRCVHLLASSTCTPTPRRHTPHPSLLRLCCTLALESLLISYTLSWDFSAPFTSQIALWDFSQLVNYHRVSLVNNNKIIIINHRVSV